jgi:hypothetical protein
MWRLCARAWCQPSVYAQGAETVVQLTCAALDTGLIIGVFTHPQNRCAASNQVSNDSVVT